MNVFRRLGRGKPKGYVEWKTRLGVFPTLHAQSRQQKANSRGQRGIPIEDLHRAIVSMEENDEELIATATRSPFSQEIREAKLLEGFKIPTLKAYEGKLDP